MTENTEYRRRKLNIWLIHHGEPLPFCSDSPPFRTARLSKELALRGHDVTYWCSSFQHHKKKAYFRDSREVKVDDYNLCILHCGSYRGNFSVGRYFHHRRMAALFAKEARARQRPDIIIASLPIHYCAYEAVIFGKENKIPVIVDIRDYWPDVFLMLFPKGLRWLGHLIFMNDFKITRMCLQNATALVSVMNRLLEWGLCKYAGRKRDSDDRVFFIGADDPGAGTGNKAGLYFPDIAKRARSRFVVTYIGSFGYLTHPMVIIEAAKYLNSAGRGGNILFVLAGNGDYYKKCVKAAGGLDNVIFTGWLDADRIAELTSISATGVIPSIEEFTFPNKAFSYLAAGLPILCSESGDLNNLLREYNAGLYFNISSPAELADRILDLSRLDGPSYRKISENARTLFQERLTADKIYKEYAGHVEYIVDKYKP